MTIHQVFENVFARFVSPLATSFFIFKIKMNFQWFTAISRKFVYTFLALANCAHVIFVVKSENFQLFTETFQIYFHLFRVLFYGIEKLNKFNEKNVAKFMCLLLFQFSFSQDHLKVF